LPGASRSRARSRGPARLDTAQGGRRRGTRRSSSTARSPLLLERCVPGLPWRGSPKARAGHRPIAIRFFCRALWARTGAGATRFRSAPADCGRGVGGRVRVEGRPPRPIEPRPAGPGGGRASLSFRTLACHGRAERVCCAPTCIAEERAGRPQARSVARDRSKARTWAIPPTTRLPASPQLRQASANADPPRSPRVTWPPCLDLDSERPSALAISRSLAFRKSRDWARSRRTVAPAD